MPKDINANTLPLLISAGETGSGSAFGRPLDSEAITYPGPSSMGELGRERSRGTRCWETCSLPCPSSPFTDIDLFFRLSRYPKPHIPISCKILKNTKVFKSHCRRRSLTEWSSSGLVEPFFFISSHRPVTVWKIVTPVCSSYKVAGVSVVLFSKVIDVRSYASPMS